MAGPVLRCAVFARVLKPLSPMSTVWAPGRDGAQSAGVGLAPRCQSVGGAMAGGHSLFPRLPRIGGLRHVGRHVPSGVAGPKRPRQPREDARTLISTPNATLHPLRRPRRGHPFRPVRSSGQAASQTVPHPARSQDMQSRRAGRPDEGSYPSYQLPELSPN